MLYQRKRNDIYLFNLASPHIIITDELKKNSFLFSYKI